MNYIKTILALLFFTFSFSLFSQSPCDVKGQPYSTLPGDTTLLLPGGTYVTFNRCEYFDLRDCLEFDELYDQASILARGLTTQDNRGNILMSCGMFQIRLNPGCTDKKCFEVPVKVRMPYKPNLSDRIGDSCFSCPRRSILLFTSSGGNWSDSSRTDSKIIELNGKQYFEFTATCANKAYNCDCAKKGKTKIRFKSRSGEKIDELFIRSACPVSVLKFYNLQPRRRLVVKLPCMKQNELFVKAVTVDASGQRSTGPEKLLSTLRHGSARKVCGKRIKRRESEKVARVTEVYYRKYFVE